MRAQGRTATTKRPCAIVAQAAPDAMSSSGIGRTARNGADGGNGKRTRCKEAERDRYLAQDHDRISQNDRADTKRGDWTSRRDRDDGRDSDHHRRTDAPIRPGAQARGRPRGSRTPAARRSALTTARMKNQGCASRNAGVIVLDERDLDLAGRPRAPQPMARSHAPAVSHVRPAGHRSCPAITPAETRNGSASGRASTTLSALKYHSLTEEAVGDRADADGEDRGDDQ